MAEKNFGSQPGTGASSDLNLPSRKRIGAVDDAENEAMRIAGRMTIRILEPEPAAVA